MSRMRSIGLAAIAAAALSIAVAVPGVTAATNHATRDSLVVKITETGSTVWGTVTVDYKSSGKLKMLGSCHKVKCTLHPPHMAKLTLHEKAFSSATWPFHGWTLKNGHGKSHTSMGKTLTFEIKNGMASVTANYVLKS